MWAYNNHMETIRHQQATIGPLIHFLKGRCMVPPFSGAAGFDPLPPLSLVQTCYNTANAELVFHAVALIPSVFHGADV
jgi:hypothetical protein